MSKTATLKGKISLDSTEFDKALRRATDRARKFASDAAGAVGTAAKAGLIGLGAAGIGAAGGLLAAAKSAADLGGQLSDASAVTGVAADKMLVLQQAFANAGMSGEGVAGVIAKMQASIGKAGIASEETQEEIDELKSRISELQSLKGAMDPKDQARANKEIEKSQKRIRELARDAKGAEVALRMMGLDRDSLVAMDGAQQLQAVFEGLARLPTQVDKMTALKMLRLPPELMVLAKDPNAFKAAKTQLGQLVGIMANVDMVSQFDRISDILSAKPGILFKQMGAGFLKELTGSQTLQEALNWFEALDLTSVGEKIGAQAAALVDIIRATIENNGGDIWKSLGVGLEFLSAKAMELFVSATQIAAGAAMGAMQTIFSDEGGQLASSISGLLVGAFIFAGVQISRILGSLMDDMENQMKGSKTGRLLLGLTSLADLGMNPFADKGASLSNLWDAIAGIKPKTPEEQKAALQEKMNEPISLLGMTPQELAATTASQAAATALNAGNFAQALAENIAAGINQAKTIQGSNPATDAVNAARQKLVNAAGPDGQQLYDRLYNGTPTVPIMPPQRQMPQAPAQSPMQWTFPDGTRNKGKGGDTGPKQVEVLERVASLLERNLVSLQIA